MLINIFDTETSGFNPPHLCELAACLIDSKGDEYHFQEYAKPDGPVEPQAEQVHGLSDAFLADKRPSKAVVDEWWSDTLGLRQPGEPLVLSGHNLKFDQNVVNQYMELPKNAWYVCTLRLCRHFYPDAENHKLTTMHSALGLTGTYQAHSALDDVLMTRDLLKYIIKAQNTCIEDLASLMSRPVRLKVMPFGKHKGVPIAAVPTSYLKWMLDNATELDPDVSFTFQAEIGKRGSYV